MLGDRMTILILVMVLWFAVVSLPEIGVVKASKPSVPDFTAKAVADTLEVTIKNQPITSENVSLYYMLRFKDNSSNYKWNYSPEYFVLPSTYGGYHEASDSDYTIILLSLDGYNFPSEKIDVQVIALVGTQNYKQDYIYGFSGESSRSWGEQTINIGENLPSLAIFQFLFSSWFAIIVVVVVVAVMVVAVIYKRKLRPQSN